MNDWVVHGIPSTEVVLAAGDLISIDFGAVVDGWHGDAAITVAVGPVDERSQALSDACEAAMWAGLAAVAAGARLGDVSHAIETSVRAGESRHRGSGGSSTATADTASARPCTWLRTS